MGSAASNGIVGDLRRARAEGYALGSFNITGFDPMLALGKAAATCGAPAIVQVSEGVLEAYGSALFKGWFDLVRRLSSATLYLHLDHSSNVGLIEECIDRGWDSVMFDGSAMPIELNTELTAAVVRKAHAHGVAVEAELGGVGGVEDGAARGGRDSLAVVQQVPEFTEKTGIDFLAVGFGNAHGHYESTAGLQWDILERAARATSIPLVLHGGTGLSSAEFSRAIRNGCAKINISTALKEQYVAVLADASLSGVVGKQPVKLHLALQERCAATCEHFIKQFQST